MAEVRKLSIAVEEVPVQLRDLIAVAEQWGIWDNHRRDEILEATTTEELRTFVRTVETRRKEIDAWLDSMPKNVRDWPKAAEIFLALVKTWHDGACDLFARENVENAKQ